MTRDCFSLTSMCAAIALLATVGVHASPSPDPTVASAEDRPAILNLIERFRAAIIAKDKAALDKLFLPDGVSWVEVFGSKIHEKARVGHPETTQIHLGSPKQFSKYIASEKRRPEERFSDLHIQSDGAVATVYFDYVFLIDDKETNRGHETWQLVKGADGWKINALAYSVVAASPD